MSKLGFGLILRGNGAGWLAATDLLLLLTLPVAHSKWHVTEVMKLEPTGQYPERDRRVSSIL